MYECSEFKKIYINRIKKIKSNLLKNSINKFGFLYQYTILINLKKIFFQTWKNLRSLSGILLPKGGEQREG